MSKDNNMAAKHAKAKKYAVQEAFLRTTHEDIGDGLYHVNKNIPYTNLALTKSKSHGFKTESIDTNSYSSRAIVLRVKGCDKIRVYNILRAIGVKYATTLYSDLVFVYCTQEYFDMKGGNLKCYC